MISKEESWPTLFDEFIFSTFYRSIYICYAIGFYSTNRVLSCWFLYKDFFSKEREHFTFYLIQIRSSVQLVTILDGTANAKNHSAIQNVNGYDRCRRVVK